MSTLTESPKSSRSSAASLEFFKHLTAKYPPTDIAVRCWDGGELIPPGGKPIRATLVLNHPGSLRQIFWPFNKAAMGEGYIFDDIDIEGEIEPFLEYFLEMRARCVPEDLPSKLALFRKLLALPNEARPRTNRAADVSGKHRSESRDQQAIEYHYDGPPSEFYRLCLGKYMQYTCNYFTSPDEDIDTAQERKLEHICRKLNLKPGERLIDFGCGWGGLITYAAKHYGVEAVGVSISKEQIKWINRLVEEEGLQGRCRVEYCDYRRFPEAQPFDKAVSVGFIEHLGLKMMPTFFGKVMRLLKPGGLYLHHGITMRPFGKFPPWRKFAQKYVFPDGELVPINDTCTELARAGLEIRDVESLREHYIYTLRRWRELLEQNHDEAVRLTDEVNYRIFRVYFAGATLGFRNHTYNLHQTLTVKSGNAESGLPLTRAAWYRNA